MSWYENRVLSSHLRVRNVYKDQYSLEKSTGVIKPKFKLAGYFSPELDIFNFFVLTSNPDSCDKLFTIIVLEKEWIKPEPFFRGNSYIDAKKIDTLTGKEILNKINNKTNKFCYSAELPVAKWQQFKKVLFRIDKSKKQIPVPIREAMFAALSESTSQVLKKFDL